MSLTLNAAGITLSEICSSSSIIDERFKAAKLEAIWNGFTSRSCNRQGNSTLTLALDHRCSRF